MGVPMVGCKCDVCTSTSPYNQRLRSAGLIVVNERKFLIDAGPDFRTQALKHQIDDLAGVLLTHAHADHIGGVDDLRAYYFLTKKKMPCLLSQETLDELKVRFHYLFRPIKEGKSLTAQIEFQVLSSDFGQVDFEGLPVGYLSYDQGGMKVTGFRIGNFAYVSDIRDYTERVFEILDGVETLVISAHGKTTPMHLSLEEAIAFAQRTRAKRTYFTHCSHALDYARTNALLPKDFALSYDGLELKIQL